MDENHCSESMIHQRLGYVFSSCIWPGVEAKVEILGDPELGDTVMVENVYDC